jgi:hypothetical protein
MNADLSVSHGIQMTIKMFRENKMDVSAAATVEWTVAAVQCGYAHGLMKILFER